MTRAQEPQLHLVGLRDTDAGCEARCRDLSPSYLVSTRSAAVGGGGMASGGFWTGLYTLPQFLPGALGVLSPSAGVPGANAELPPA